MSRCALIVEFDLKPGALGQFLEIMTSHARLTLEQEPGCRQFDVLRPETDENRILLVEVYDDRAAYEAHRQGHRMPGVNAALEPLLVGRKVTVCAIL